jgi:stage V sporulation protein B
MKSTKNFLITGSIILTISNVAVRLLSYVYRVIMGRLLNPYHYGILNLALPLQFAIIVLTSSGIAPSIAKFISECKAKEGDLDRLASSCIFYYTLVGVALGLGFFALAPFLGTFIFSDENVILPLQISAVAVPFGILISVYTGIFQGLKKITFMSAVLLLEQALRIILAVCLVAIGFKAVGAIGGPTFGFVLAVPFSYYLFKRTGLNFANRDLGIFKDVFMFSIPTTITALSSFILAYADIVIIGFYKAPTDVGIYSAASPASRLILAFTMALYAVLIPTTSELSAKGSIKDLKRYFKMSVTGLIGLVFPATFIAYSFSTEIITLLFTNAYVLAIPSFQILVVGVAFLSLFMMSSAIFQGLGRPMIPMKILGIFAFIDILLNFMLIPLYGIEGAAFSTALAGIGAGLVSTVLLAKYLNTIG